MKPTSPRLRRAVLPVHTTRSGVLGTATVIGEGLALTSVGVVAPEPGELTLGVGPGLPVLAVETVPASELALLVAPGLDVPALLPRAEPVRVGEHVLLPGYPDGYWAVRHSRVASAAVDHFTVRLPPCPGSPALDVAGRLIGITVAAAGHGTRCAGPSQLTGLLDQLLTVTG